MSRSRTLAIAAAALIAISGMARAEEIGEVTTVFNLLSPNHKIKIEAFDDPVVSGVACHVSRAVAGGYKSYVGMAEDPSNASIACRQIGPITADLKALRARTGAEGETVFKASASILFKKVQVVRFVDLTRSTLVYLIYTDKLIEGSPQNSISTVPVQPWGR
jgi:CreA protein